MPSLITTGWRTVATNIDDTLQKVAYRELGDASRWPELATLNKLLPPYLIHIVRDLDGNITNSSSELAQIAADKALVMGAAIKIPIAAVIQGAVTPTKAFGIDILLDKGQVTAAGNDLNVGAGIVNLKQALLMRLQNDIGCLPFHPKYGNAACALRGHKNDPSIAMLALRFCEETLLSDPRVVKVTDGQATQVGDVLNVVITAVTNDGIPLRLQVEI